MVAADWRTRQSLSRQVRDGWRTGRVTKAASVRSALHIGGRLPPSWIVVFDPEPRRSTDELAILRRRFPDAVVDRWTAVDPAAGRPGDPRDRAH